MSQENANTSWEQITPTSNEVREANRTIIALVKFIKDIIIIILLALTFRFFLFTPFQIQGTSMNNSYSHNEYIIVDIFSYLNFNTFFQEGWISGILKKIPIHIGDPKRGDVIVLKPHVNNEREYYLKRVIGLPGEEIRIGSWQVYIKTVWGTEFVQLNEPYLSLTNSGQTLINEQYEPKTFSIPEWHYWVMGDNRNHSSDSRDCFRSCQRSGSTHFLKREDIVGKVAVSLWYFNIFSDFPHLGNLSWEVSPRFFNTPKSAEYPELDRKNE